MSGLTVHPSTGSGRTVKLVCHFVKRLLNDYLPVETGWSFDKIFLFQGHLIEIYIIIIFRTNPA
jgi:hypothetical protein